MAPPLDPKQYRWWYRIRRMPAPVFVIGIGAIGATAFVIGMHVVVAGLMLGHGVRLEPVVIMAAVLVPAFWGAFAWTWSWMERRFAETCLCPDCGYDVRASVRDRCPECGRSLTT